MAKKIERHRTAIDRYSLSAPMQSLYRHDYFSKNSILDYGCGKGDDFRILKQHNVNIVAWDPVYFPDGKKIPCDIVNLGYVINVIEDQEERKKTLLEAHSYAIKFLAVAVMLGGEAIISRFEKSGDGVVTTRNTFQKYYTQKEIRQYIETILGEEAIAVSPGIFYIFKDKIEEQTFLVNREKSKRNWQRLSYVSDPKRLEVKQRAFYESNKSILEDFWSKCLELGRIPGSQEFVQSEQLRSMANSHNKAFQLLKAIHGEEIFTSAAKARKNDLLVYFSLGLFGHRKSYLNMPDVLKRDIRSFWGSYSNILEESKELLFSAGKSEVIKAACTKAYEKLQCGQLVPGHSFLIHRKFLEELPAVLRVYIGCASQLYGDMSEIDLIKIHINSGKLTLLRFDDFLGKPLPLLLQRIKIKLRELDIDFFDYGEKFPPQPLYLKSSLLNEDMQNFSKQKSFDKRLQSFAWFNTDGYGPSKEELTELLQDNNLQIKGFQFYKIKLKKIL